MALAAEQLMYSKGENKPQQSFNQAADKRKRNNGEEKAWHQAKAKPKKRRNK